MIDFTEPIETSRTYEHERRVALSDTDSSGRLRIDACARFLQDVAAFDAIDADISHMGNWVLRQNLIDARALPSYGSNVRSMTYLTGSGRAWIERSTVITDTSSAEPQIRVKALWVLTNSRTGAPISIPSILFDIYGPLATYNKITIRNGKRPALPGDVVPLNWQIRFSDQDILSHLNNATYLEAVEEALHLNEISLSTRSRFTCEVVYREATSYDDQSSPFYSIKKGDNSTNVELFFATDGVVRCNISLAVQA